MKVKTLGARHPGLIQKVDAMFEAFMTLDAVREMIVAEYGERISCESVRKYKKQDWKVRRQRELAQRASQIAYQELVSEGRN
jgi:hypothetical protein